MSLYTKIIDLQKLNAAWKRVRANKPAAGIDDVTWEMYDSESISENKMLNAELSKNEYKCKPVKTVVLYQNGKERTIALYCMRDKVVQQSIAEELNRIYDSQFTAQTYAYRNNKSALSASEEIEREIHTGRYAWVLKVDIQKYFDSIQWDILEKILRIRNPEDDAMELIHDSCTAPSVDSEGNLCPKRVGIHQGSSIAPVLSNIYLMEFDKWMICQGVYFIRYSDDILILGKEKERLQELLGQIQTRLEALGLIVSEKKTVLCSLEDGVEFLGFAFDKSGKCITPKAEEQLGARLESVWLLNRNTSCQKRLQKMSEVLNGWEQYFRGKRKPADILEYVTLVYMVRNKEQIKGLAEIRTQYVNIYPDILRYLLSIWSENERLDLCLFEYEQYYGVLPNSAEEKKYDRKNISVLLEQYAALLEDETKDHFGDLMQTYADLHFYEQAAVVSEKIKILESRDRKGTQIDTGLVKEHDNESQIQQLYDEEDIEQYMNLFVGREDVFAVVDYVGGRKQTSMKMQPITKELIRKHLSGDCVLATYIQRQNATVKYMILDVDVSRKIIIECDGNRERLYPYLKDAASVAAEIGKWFHSKGIKVRYEFSGGRGYHIWLFFERWIPTYYANMLQDVIEKEFFDRFGTELTLEFFPNKTKLRNGKIGQCIKLPLSISREAAIRSILLDDDFCESERIKDWIHDTPKYSLNVLKKIVSVPDTSQNEKPNRMIDSDLTSFGDLEPNIREILEKCNLMRYLCRKALDTGYLTHFERLSVLYVFGHAGNDGKRFVHQVMSYTINYKYNVTEKFIRKCPEKPISCMKLRNQYKSVTAEIGCSCIFRRNDKCYPSPVLHAISSSSEDNNVVTIPTSRTLTEEKSKDVADEMNIHKRVQALAARILELKKQRRGIDSSVRKVEKELERLFDEENIESLELEMGLLVRRKKENGYEWLIEI